MMDAFFQLRKVDEEKRLVYGRATQEVVDRSGEIMDYDTSKPLIEAWSREAVAASGGLSKGNVRSQHRKDSAAGKGVDIEFDDSLKAVDIVVKVVDDGDWKKVQEGVYTGFSMGGSYAKKWTDPDLTAASGKTVVRYTAQPSEVSLVDRPCVPTAGFFEVQKTDGTTEQRAFHQGENMAENTPPVEAPENPEAPPTEDLKKGLWEGKRFLDLLEDTRWLQMALADEKRREGDASMVPEDLKTCLGMLAELTEKYIGEQLAELKAGGSVAAASEAAGVAEEASEKADKADDLEKAARTGRKAMRAKLKEHADGMAALCKAYLDTYGKEDEMEGADKADEGDGLEKSAAPDMEDMIRRAVADAVRPLQESLTKSAPVAPVAAKSAPNLRALDKDDDSGLAKADKELEELRKAAEGDGPEAIRASIKLAQLTTATLIKH